MKKIIIMLALLGLLTSCSSDNTYEYQSITSNDAMSIMENNKYQIIDVRTPEEYEESHVKGAINVLYTEVDTITIDKDTIILVYCASGRRSKIAAESLLQMGYQVYDLGSINNITLEKVEE